MKFKIHLLLSFFLFFSCQKEEITEGINNDNQEHSYTGDLLLLVVSDTLEAAYTYSIGSANLYTDSLPLFYTFSAASPFDDIDAHMHFASTADTLYTRSYSGTLSYNASPLDLEQINNSYHYMNIPFDLKNFTIDINNKLALEKCWNKISYLSIVRSYRSLTKSKVFGHRMIAMEFNPDLGFSTPKEKYIFILSKW